MDLGADGFQTFRHVILPNIGTALLAGGMLAFALSFDEVIVTTFTAGQQQTLPIWMLAELIRPRQRPVTNVVAMVVVLVTLLPILAAYYLTRDGEQIAAVRGNSRHATSQLEDKFMRHADADRLEVRGGHRSAEEPSSIRRPARPSSSCPKLARADRCGGRCRARRPSRPGRARRRPSAPAIC